MKPSILSHSVHAILRDLGENSTGAELVKSVLDPLVGVVALQGPPGVGKTSLVRLVAQSLSSVFPGGAYWVLPSYGPFAEQVERAQTTLSDGSLVVIDEWDAFKGRSPMGRLLSAAERHANKSTVLIVGRSDIGLPDVDALVVAMRPGPPLVPSWILGEASEDIASYGSFTQVGLIDQHGSPLSPSSPAGQTLIVEARKGDRELLRRIGSDPDLIYQISPRRFEELVAKVYEELGYEVSLTPASGDGGRDLQVAKKDHLGSFLYFVECKRYSKDRPVGVGLVRQLHGVVSAAQASAGVLITTSSFTKGARAFQEAVPHRMSLKAYTDFRAWLAEAGFSSGAN
ncbi:restriction endonuclease [Brevundimonas sp.]|uniref:restriction endonuclease n=1 Tax=Brevundimonas sp. TaxID=1871086 RepID=UPI003AF94F00